MRENPGRVKGGREGVQDQSKGNIDVEGVGRGKGPMEGVEEEGQKDSIKWGGDGRAKAYSTRPPMTRAGCLQNTWPAVSGQLQGYSRLET